MFRHFLFKDRTFLRTILGFPLVCRVAERFIKLLPVFSDKRGFKEFINGHFQFFSSFTCRITDFPFMIIKGGKSRIFGDADWV